MTEIFHRFYKKFTHHLGTKQREDVEGMNWVKPLLCSQRNFSCRFLIDNCPAFGILFGNFRLS